MNALFDPRRLCTLPAFLAAFIFAGLLAVPRSLALDAEALPSWRTVFGGVSWEVIRDVASDSAGNALVCGDDDGPTARAAQWTNEKPEDGPCEFIAKVNGTTGALLWLTWFARLTGGHSLAVDDAGNAYVAGGGNSLFMVGTDVPEGDGLFVAKFAPNGARLWTRFLSKFGGGGPTGICGDGKGHVYVSGCLPSWGQLLHPEDTAKPAEDNMVVCKLTDQGAEVWSRYVGGRASDRTDLGTIAVDSKGNAYVGGSIGRNLGAGTQYDLTALKNSAYLGGDTDGFVAQLDGTDGHILWSLLVGGSAADKVHRLSVDPYDQVYVTGGTTSSDLNPPRANSYIQADGDSFFLKLKPDGTVLWSSYGHIGVRGDHGRSVFTTMMGLGVIGVTEDGILVLDPATGLPTYGIYHGSIFPGDAIGEPVAAPAGPWSFFIGGTTSLGDANAMVSRVEITPCPDSFEPNDVMSQASSLCDVQGRWLSSLPSTPSVAGLDWYAVCVDPGSPQLKIELRNPDPPSDFTLELFDASGQSLTWDAMADTNKAELVVLGPAPGIYYVCLFVRTKLPDGANRCTSYDLRWDDGVSGWSGNPPPTFTQHPASQAVPTGGKATLTAAASGAGPLTYQWLFNGVSIPDAESNTYTIPQMTAEYVGDYAVMVSGGGLNVLSKPATLTVQAPGSRGPFGGVPWPIPGTVEAERFDEGGEGIAYHDTDTVNTGSAGTALRTTAVDLDSCADAGGGFNVGGAHAGEWVEYTVNVLADGIYTIEVRVASPNGGGQFHLEFNGVNKTGAMTVPNTGGWQTYRTVGKTGVSLSAGIQIMRLVMDAGSNIANFNYVRVSGNQPPTVAITSPANADTFVAPATITISATASDTDGTISKVEFYAGGTRLGEDTTAPYAYTWSGVPAGDYALSARVTDDQGASTVSPSVTAQVLGPIRVDFSGLPLVGAAPLTVQFTDQSTPAPMGWVWTFGDGANSTLSSPAHAYQRPGRYDVHLTVQHPSGSFSSLKSGYIHVIKDQNGDGVDDDWVKAYFGTNPFNPNGDADGDGHSNADEFNLGTDPVDEHSVLAVIDYQVVVGKQVLLGWPAVPKVAYEVQVRNLLEPSAPWLGLTAIQLECECKVSVAVPYPFDDHGFYRIAARARP